MATGKRGAKREIKMVERRERALQLRKAGVSSLRRIAEQLTKEGYPVSYEQVRIDIREALRERRQYDPELVAEVLGLQQERIDALVLALWSTAMDPPLVNVRDRSGNLVYDAPGSIAKEADYKAQAGAVERIIKMLAHEADLLGVKFLDRVKAEAQRHNAETYALLERILMESITLQGGEELANNVQQQFRQQLQLASVGGRAGDADSNTAVEAEFRQI